VSRKKDIHSEETFVSMPSEELIISKSATIYCGLSRRLEAHGKSKALTKKTIGIGRDKSNSIIIADTKVSKFHALINFKPDAAYIRDSHSTNGTQVNGETIVAGKDRELRDGDVIVVGTTRLKIRY
jgi:predicted component of type VI protein secretion system